MIAGSYSMVHQNGGLAALLPKYFPEHSWDLEKLKATKVKASQRHLKKLVEEIFPSKGTIFRYNDDRESLEINVSSVAHKCGQQKKH
jgi:hypothetical protein